MTFSGIGGTIGTLGTAATVFGPLGPAVGAAVGGIADIFAADDSARQQRKAAKAQNNANKANWRYERGEQQRVYSYNVRKQEIDKRNTEANLKYQEDMLAQSWNYQMGIRDYEFDQMNRAYEKTVQQANQQLDFNQLAFEQANMQQNRYIQEQMQGFALDQKQTLLNYSAAIAGLDLSARKTIAEANLAAGQAVGKAALSRRQTTAAQARALERIEATSRFGLQKTALEELKVKGTAAARGQAGRSVAKVQQGIGAEAGAQKAAISKEGKLAKGAANEEAYFAQAQVLQDLMQTQASIAQQLMFAEEDVDLNYDKLNNQFFFDQAKVSLSVGNLAANDALVRKQIDLQKKQADMNAMNSIMLKPEIAPPIPEPLTLPRPEWPKVFKPYERPEPEKNTVYQSINPYTQLASGILGGIGSAVNIINKQNQPTVGGGNVGVLGSIFGGNTPSLGVANMSEFDLNPGWFTP